MKYRKLGKTGFSISEIGFGAWAIGGALNVFGTPAGWSNVNESDAEAAVLRAYELGVNFYDTADFYGAGRSESLLGHCLKGKDALIATKVGIRIGEKEATKDFSSEYIRRCVEDSLRRLGRDSIDVYQFHNPGPEVLQSTEPFETMEKLKEEGKIRAIGVSISHPDEGIRLIEDRKVDCLQVLINILNQEPARQLLPLAEKENIGIIARVPLASGLLTGKFTPEQRFYSDDSRSNYLTPFRMNEALQKVERLKEISKVTGFTLGQISLSFLLKFSGISSAIPGAKNTSQVEQNVSASGVEMDDDLFSSIKKEFATYNFFLRYHVRV